MSTRKELFITLLAAILLVGVFSWPLYLHFADGIPYSSRRTEPEPVRHMVMGDHLQLLYHFWLPADWVAGGTRFGYDLYQFNAGDDDFRSFPKTDYLPFTGIFALLHLFFGRATSWNAVSVFAIWMALFFTWRLVRLHEVQRWPSFTLALMAISFPYQWACLFGGSPTGFAMMTVPMLFYGIERAVRHGSLVGGLLAAAAITTAFWTDTHVLLFSYMLGPFWVFMTVLHDGKFPWRNWADRMARIKALLPLLVMAVLTMSLRLRTKQRFDDESVVGGGWSWDVLRIFSPSPRGLFTWQSMRHDYHVYLGYLIVTILIVAFAIAIVAFVRRKQWNRLLYFCVLAAALLVMVAFSLGTNGPRHGIFLQLARSLVPPITMMRQTAKIFAMFGPIIAVLAVPLWQWLSADQRNRMVRTILPAMLALAVISEWVLQVRPGISILNVRQEAYAAVAADAVDARAVAVPIWPGDSAWSSLYQHDSSLHRLRMLNGYSPVVSSDYIDKIFSPLISLNSGVLTDAQIDFLKSMGVRYLIFQQDAFPEQVSWFPVGATLQKFLRHPRLELLRQDRNVYAFRIGDRAKPAESPAWDLFGSRFMADASFERAPEGAIIAEDPTAGFGRFMRLAQPGSAVWFRQVDQYDMPDPLLMVRARGRGQWNVMLQQCDTERSYPMQVNSEEWTWVVWPLSWIEDDCTWWRVGFQLQDGQLDLDAVSFVSGVPPVLEPGESYLIKAPTFYHAGYTDLDKDAVVLTPQHEPTGRIFYGPRWVLPDGVYSAEIEWVLPPLSGELVGRLEIKLNPQRVEGVVEIRGPSHEPLVFSTRPVNLPLEFGLHYERKAKVAIRGIRITRIE
jgi:hypothetical protein